MPVVRLEVSACIVAGIGPARLLNCIAILKLSVQSCRRGWGEEIFEM